MSENPGVPKIGSVNRKTGKKTGGPLNSNSAQIFIRLPSPRLSFANHLPLTHWPWREYMTRVPDRWPRHHTHAKPSHHDRSGGYKNGEMTSQHQKNR